VAFCLTVAIAAGHLSQGASQDFGRGLSAFYSRDYATALDHWAPLAVAGDPKAQSGLGYLYLFGLGVPYDIEQAVNWYVKAADQGEPEAQAFLGAFYAEGRGVERDLVQALKWCELAIWNGSERGMKCREDAIAKMSADEMRESWRLFNAWVEDRKPHT
jgi:TPR repeat protein